MRKRRRSLSPALVSTLQRVMDLRGSQKYYYHVHSLNLPHRWDHEDPLNFVQRELEATFGEDLVSLVAVREWNNDRGEIVCCFYFRIGPLPSPDQHFPIERTVLARSSPPAEANA